MVQANTQGSDGIGNINNFVCPECGAHLVKAEGKCDCEYVCMTIECRGMNINFPSYYGYTQKDIDNNYHSTFKTSFCKRCIKLGQMNLTRYKVAKGCCVHCGAMIE